uniref:Uncharacterized protein n=1 Tax=Octactis speculum TaxID=3111310 RepID=A0A6U3UXW4_9STRA|mmetsp:Transcript_43176/g.58999  ORF Transcript_43176/g.58999 Transcript_43176/m.58999 type:complete len:241 (+) Transcript_43176:112-834(+)
MAEMKEDTKEDTKEDFNDAKAVDLSAQDAGMSGASSGDYDVKVILLGDSATGKSKLMERFMMNDYNPIQQSTFALNTFRKTVTVDSKSVEVEFWDTAGQERFQKVHPAYYTDASACILVFDVTRKATYQHLSTWYDELRAACGNVPCILVANKIDINYEVTNKKYKFAEKNDLKFFFTSASDGTNVVSVFEQAVHDAVQYRRTSNEARAKGIYEDTDIGFEAEVQDLHKYFDEKEREGGD